MSIPDLNNKLNYLIDTKELIRTAIRNKGVQVLSSDTFRSYANKIDSINTIPGDGNITPTDVAYGKYGYANNSTVYGNVTTIEANITNLASPNMSIDSSNIYIRVTNIVPDNVLYRPNSVIEMDFTKTDFCQLANITADKIKSGDSILNIDGTVNFESFNDYNVCNQLALDIIS